jgi:hypothetical protein
VEAESLEGWKVVVGGRRGEGDELGSVVSFINHVAHRHFKLIRLGSKVCISASIHLNPVCCIFTEKGLKHPVAWTNFSSGHTATRELSKKESEPAFYQSLS